MLAPTRDLVARLNQPRPHSPPRGRQPRAEVELADGNQACVGDVVLTRHNDRRLGVSGTDWVKNGDRWTVTGVARDGSLDVRHLRRSCTSRCPRQYVAEHVELGYATTVHAAQGVTADVMHGILTGHRGPAAALHDAHPRPRREPPPRRRRPVRARRGTVPSRDRRTSHHCRDPRPHRRSRRRRALRDRPSSPKPPAQPPNSTRPHAGTPTPSPPQPTASSDPTPPRRSHPRTDHCRGCRASPTDVRKHPQWSSYLTARAERVDLLADRVRRDTALPASLARFNDVLPPRAPRRGHRLADCQRDTRRRPQPPWADADRLGRTSLRPSPSAAGRRPVPRLRPPLGATSRRVHRQARRARRTHPRPGSRARPTRAHRHERRSHVAPRLDRETASKGAHDRGARLPHPAVRQALSVGRSGPASSASSTQSGTRPVSRYSSSKSPIASSSSSRAVSSCIGCRAFHSAN